MQLPPAPPTCPLSAIQRFVLFLVDDKLWLGPQVEGFEKLIGEWETARDDGRVCWHACGSDFCTRVVVGPTHAITGMGQGQDRHVRHAVDSYWPYDVPSEGRPLGKASVAPSAKEALLQTSRGQRGEAANWTVFAVLWQVFGLAIR